MLIYLHYIFCLNPGGQNQRPLSVASSEHQLPVPKKVIWNGTDMRNKAL